MTDAERRQLQSAVRNAARKASRNPRPDQPDLAGELAQVGLAYLDAHHEQIEQQLSEGKSAYTVAHALYGAIVAHMVSWRKSDNAAYWAAAKAAKAA